MAFVGRRCTSLQHTATAAGARRHTNLNSSPALLPMCTHTHTPELTLAFFCRLLEGFADNFDPARDTDDDVGYFGGQMVWSSGSHVLTSLVAFIWSGLGELGNRGKFIGCGMYGKFKLRNRLVFFIFFFMEMFCFRLVLHLLILL